LAIETTLPRVFAHRAFGDAEILALAAALMVRRPLDPRLVVVPLNASIAISRALTCCAALSRSIFNRAMMSMFIPFGAKRLRAEIVTDIVDGIMLLSNKRSTFNFQWVT